MYTVSTEKYGRMYRGIVYNEKEEIVCHTSPYHHKRNALKSAKVMRSAIFNIKKNIERAKNRSA